MGVKPPIINTCLIQVSLTNNQFVPVNKRYLKVYRYRSCYSRGSEQVLLSNQLGNACSKITIIIQW